ncbi:oligosaccharide flippase family protein [uncultured Phocaeicola sp.]|uniref:lipopolysaccharide biosynthesis protein n=1 Tax=uncultured Phocaeicola sp. TaxID=990718 RepID=UPI0025966C6A|nr:oligosaccharide flippase family protein [uncultured Phocaeicola sp.]
MSENSYKKAGTFYFIGNIFNKGISFLTVPVFTRILSTADYGIVTTYNSWIGILSMIVGFALHMSVRMAAVDYKDKLDDFMSSIILFVTLTSFGITALVAGSIKLLHIDANIVLVVICMLQAYASATIEDYSNYLMMKYEYKARTALMVLPNLISVVLSVYMIKYVLESDLYMGRIIPTAVVTIFFGLVTVCITLKKGKIRINKEYIKYAMAISAPLILHGIALNILSQSDRIMITSLAGAAQTGIYSLIYNFSMIATVITTTLEGIWVPWFINKLKLNSRDEINVVAKDYINLMTYAMVALILIAPEVVKILANESYWEGISIIPPVVLANYVIFAYSLYVNIEHYYKKTPYITVNTIIAAASNIVLNYIFIPKYGYIAAAYTTLASYLISFVLHSRYARKLEPNLYPLRQFMEPIIHLLTVTVIFYAFKNQFVIRWLLMVVYIASRFYKERKRLKMYFPNIPILKGK